jgi:hypothetical protein
VVHGDKAPEAALLELMTRQPTEEWGRDRPGSDTGSTSSRC